MKRAILIHGRPDKNEYYDPSLPTPSNDHWFPWLSKKLQDQDVFTVAIEVPRPYSPRYEIWRRELERFDIDENTVLVGHSCGAGFLVRWLTETDQKVGRVVLVAPWINPSNDPESDTADFFDFEIDPQIASKTERLIIFSSSNDEDSVQRSIGIINQKVNNIEMVKFENYGHFCKEEMGSVEFPELYEACTGQD